MWRRVSSVTGGGAILCEGVRIVSVWECYFYMRVCESCQGKVVILCERMWIVFEWSDHFIWWYRVTLSEYLNFCGSAVSKGINQDLSTGECCHLCGKALSAFRVAPSQWAGLTRPSNEDNMVGGILHLEPVCSPHPIYGDAWHLTDVPPGAWVWYSPIIQGRSLYRSMMMDYMWSIT